MEKTVEEKRVYSRENSRKWRANHPEYRQTDRFKEMNRTNVTRWRREHPEKYAVIQARYYAKKAGGKFIPAIESASKEG